jgi:phytol kinase
LLGFTLYDTLGGLLVYAYIGIVFVVVEKLWKGDRAVGRKILHIGMGNIVFILLFFDNWYAEVLIAGSALLFSLIITQRMQLYFLSKLTVGPGEESIFRKAYRKIIKKLSLISASDAGNEWGLVYYCLMFTVLAGLFAGMPVVVAVGMLPLAYGDGLGAVIGRKFGRHPYRIIDKKSIEGSLAVFAGTAGSLLVGMVYYGAPLFDAAWMAAAIGVVVMVVEGVTPKGLDNLAIPLSAVAMYLLFGWP